MPPLPVDAAALLAAIVASSDDAIVSKDLNGIITSWNRGAERIFGYTAEEAIGQSIRLIIPKERQAEEDHVLAKLRRGESVDHFETIRRRKDGALIPISLTVSPVRGANGEMVGASKVARDISDRWRAEAAIAEAEAAEADLQRRLLALVGASGALLASPRVSDVLPASLALARELVPADGHIIWRLDPAAGVWSIVAHSGVSPEFASSTVSSFQAERAMMATLAAGEPVVGEDVGTLPMAPDRRELFEREGIASVLAIPLVIRGEMSGTVVFYYRQRHKFSTVEVQTARALANLAGGAMTTAELHDNQQRSHRRAAFLAQAASALGSSLDYQATLRTVADMAVPHVADWCAIELVGEEGRRERVTLAHVDPTRLEFAQSFLARYSEDPASRYSTAQVIRTGKPVLVEQLPDALLVAAARSDEHLRDLRRLNITSFMIVPLFAQGRVVGAITLVSAESGRSYGAADLQFAEDLASRASLAIDNARAYEEARRANRLKDDFLATLSHELRTPLNAILGYARMLRTGMMTGEKHARAVEILERSATALTQIVEDVLDVSRITSGKIRLALKPVELSVVVGDAVATVLPAAEAKGIVVETHLDPRGGIVRGDADRLQQVIWNLASNAVKFTPPEGRVDVRVEAVDKNVQITVTDTGIGFAKEFAPHIFEPFRQADSGFAREHGGLGLGLAIARHLVEMHGGRIEAASEGNGRGATFRVLLPAAGPARAAGVDESPARPHTRARDAGVLAGLEGLQILAVDDDPDALLLVREILEAAGARVTTVSSADAALEELGRTTPDAITTDLGMPGVDGFELIERLRRSPNAAVRGVPAIAVSAYARSQDRTKALRSGFQMHLAKPIDPGELVAAISSVTHEPNATRS